MERDNRKIGILLIATNKYQQFVQPLIYGLDKHFFVNHPVEVHLFVDDKSKYYTASNRLEIIIHTIPSYKFPLATLYRYKIFNDHKDSFGNCSHIFYSDVDMAFVDFVGDEILPEDGNEGLVATMHPGFYRGGWGSNGCNPQSTAFIPESQRKIYYAGGFQGGCRKEYLEACRTLSENISIDEEKGVMAIYHDETHWNAYLSTRTPKTLTPEYCQVEELDKRRRWGTDHFTPKILALAKDHSALRS